jgi:hypothetical protein
MENGERNVARTKTSLAPTSIKSGRLAPADDVDEVIALIRRMDKGDKAAEAEIVRRMKADTVWAETLAEGASTMRDTWINHCSSEDFTREILTARARSLKRRLIGDDPTAVDSLLAERIVICKLALDRAETMSLTDEETPTRCAKCGNPKHSTDQYCANCGTRYSDSDPRKSATRPGSVRSTIKWSAIVCLLAVCFVMSMLVYPIVAVILGLPVLFVLTNFKGLRQRTVDTWAWKHWHLPWAKTVTPAVGAALLGLWVVTSSASGYAMYSHNAGVSAQHAAATQTAVAHVTLIAGAKARRTAVVRSRVSATALTVAHKTRAARTRNRATAKALALKRAAPRQTAVAANLKATAQAVAQANAQAATVAPVVQAVAGYHTAVHTYYGMQHDGTGIPGTSTGEARLAVDCIASDGSNSLRNTNAYITYQVLGDTMGQVAISGSSATLVEYRHDIIALHHSDGSTSPNDSNYTATYTLVRSSGSWLVSDYSWTASGGSSGSASKDAQVCSNPPTTSPVAQPTPADTVGTNPAAPSSSGVNLVDHAGSGQWTSETFTAPSDWYIDYSFDCSTFGSTGNFIVSISGGTPGYSTSGVNELKTSGSGSTAVHDDSGTGVYISINSECDWTVTAHS